MGLIIRRTTAESDPHLKLPYDSPGRYEERMAQNVLNGG
jgi:hypothetical protein